MDIKEAVADAYGKLPKGLKKRAVEIYGCSVSYFDRLVAGNPKDLSVYYVALNAIKQAAKEYKEEINNKLDAVQGVKVDE
ncbi:hypothetical protein [Aquimarina algiphila]|uniref:Uncharacterized protein n=1 Tax=Aquimarina algiphila TaxID=2047982 RepID=A0A554VA35_9FLAO|nr:hypothetical protein [Aquimarina algiphila]TSE02653.1 hypothetical protein FOF46_30675 [Aquimarina algiphila]